MTMHISYYTTGQTELRINLPSDLEHLLREIGKRSPVTAADVYNAIRHSLSNAINSGRINGDSVQEVEAFLLEDAEARIRKQYAVTCGD